MWFIDEIDERDIYSKLLPEVSIYSYSEIQEIFFYVLLKNDYISLRKVQILIAMPIQNSFLF